MPEEDILHQADVENVVEEIVEENLEGLTDSMGETFNTFAVRTENSIVSPDAPGATYVQAEVVALKTAIDDIIAALIESGVLVPAG